LRGRTANACPPCPSMAKAEPADHGGLSNVAKRSSKRCRAEAGLVFILQDDVEESKLLPKDDAPTHGRSSNSGAGLDRLLHHCSLAFSRHYVRCRGSSSNRSCSDPCCGTDCMPAGQSRSMVSGPRRSSRRTRSQPGRSLPALFGPDPAYPAGQTGFGRTWSTSNAASITASGSSRRAGGRAHRAIAAPRRARAR
jgi:hypothetical protein